MKVGWQIKPVSEVCDVVNGGTPKTNVTEYWDGTYLWITPAEMGKRLTPYVGDTKRKITSSGLRNSSAHMLPPNSIILSSRAPIGHLVINTKPMSTNQGCKGLIPGNLLDYKFLYYYLSSIIDLLNSLGSGTTFKELSGGKLKEVPVPITSISEQKRIVAILDEAFANISRAKEIAEKNLANAREVFESYLQSIYSYRGEGWVEETLGNVCDLVGGSQPPKDVFTKTKTPNNIRLIQIRDYKSNNHIVYIPSSKAKRHCTENDIMIGRYGPPIFQILRGLEGAYNVALIKAVPRETKLSSDYLFYFLKHPAIQKYVIFHSERAAGQSGVNKDRLETYPIAFPSLKEQLKVTQVICKLEKEVQRMETIYQQKLISFEELKKSILQKAFSGQI